MVAFRACMDAPERFRTLRPWLLQTFGHPVHRVALDAGSTCPNRDGTRGRGGCFYCDVEGSGTGAIRTGLELREQLERALIDQVFDLQENIYFLVGEEIRFMEKAKGKGGGSKGVEGRFSRSLSWLCRFGSAGGQTLLVVLLGTLLG